MSAIHVVSASAGSGKTHRLVDELYRAITDAVHPVRPEAVIATTFTVKAAAELRERVRARLLEQGLVGEAQRLGAARIGTVNSVCANLVDELAFELGISPDTHVLDEEASKRAFERSLSGLLARVQGDEGPETNALIGPAADLLALEDRMPGLEWRDAVQAVVEYARTNRIEPGALRASATRAADSLLAYLPTARPDGAALDRELAGALAAFVGSGELDTTKVTGEMVTNAQRALARLREGKTLSWWEWGRFATSEPGAKSRTLYDPVRQAALEHARHPGLASDVRAAIDAVYELAAQAIEVYAGYKRLWGVLDFVDQEVLALDLLARPHVREMLAEQVDLVLVDEFQDTSPLQLEVFLALSQLAPRSVWVGDQKQAIYGFRGTDPALMDAAIAAIETSGGAGALETLAHSWRSRAELVRLTSDMFAPAFAAAGIPEERVRLAPAPTTPDPDELGPVAEVWRLAAGRRKAEEAGALANAVRGLLGDGSVRVRDLMTGTPRRPIPADVAVLCRTNRGARRVAAALEGSGIPAVLGRPGLIASPEARVTLAALRLWVDGRDALAAAELGRLLSRPDEPDAWLEAIVDAAGAPFNDLPDVVRVTAARAANPGAGMLAAFDAATEAVGVRERCLQWGGSGQRLGNLDLLRALAWDYAELCESEGETCTVAGLVAYLESLSADQLDLQATLGGQDAVTVSTWHGAKGLEWPVTVLYELGDLREPSAFGVSGASERETFAFEDPLGGRWIRYWPDPFRPREALTYRGKTEFHDAVRAGAEHRAEASRALREELRLLYVGWTRARDLLVLATKNGKMLDGVLDLLRDSNGAPSLAEPGVDGAAVWGGRLVRTRVRETGPGDPDYQVPEPAEGYPTREPRMYPAARAEASGASGAGVLGPSETIGAALLVSTPTDWAALGSACHAFFSADRGGLSDEERREVARGLLEAHGVLSALRPEDLAREGTSLRSWLDTRWPRARWHWEWPLMSRIPDGSQIHGFADLVLELERGLVLIDHKCVAGDLPQALASAKSYGGQLRVYCGMLERATGKKVEAAWIHLALQGATVVLDRSTND
jgi:ATP-dependent exoDNAse (exonuclease V) beta subunit